MSLLSQSPGNTQPCRPDPSPPTEQSSCHQQHSYSKLQLFPGRQASQPTPGGPLSS